jgi:hypothetical protein
MPEKPTSPDGAEILDRVLRGDVDGLKLKLDDGQARPDLGPGRCAYPYYDECRNSAAFSQQGLYDPQDTPVAQLLAARADLKRIRQQIPLTNRESAVIDQGIALLDRLIADHIDTN